MASSLPEEVTTEILVRLPVKTLLRSRSVSKRFRSLIDSPHFIKRHLAHSLNTKTNRKLILRGPTQTFPPSAKLYSSSLDHLDQARELHHPGGTQFLGSVNGLLCLQSDLMRDCVIVLWNFATGRYHNVPAPLNDFSGLARRVEYKLTTAYGFGYDAVSDDYKLFRLNHFYAPGTYDLVKAESKLYSLKSNSWQKIQDFPYYINPGKRIGVLVCGALHWVVSHTHGSHISNLIAAIDIATNECGLVDYPKFLEKGPLNVIELEGCLCVPCFSPEQVEVWMMKEYGVKESWSKLYSVSQPEVLRPFQFVVPLAYSKSGTEVMLLQDNVKLLWYSLKEGRVRRIHLRGCPDDFQPEVCVESLVPLSGKAEDYAKKKGGKDAKERPSKGGKRRNEFLSQGFKLKL